MPPRPAADALRPTAEAVLSAWAARVRADRDQVERCREIADPSDFYAPLAQRFAQDPERTDEPTLEVLRSLVTPGEVWLDIGAGGGRYALPLARQGASVIAIDPSPAMLGVLREGMERHAIRDIDIVEGRWPDVADRLPRAQVALMAHVGYDIEAIGPSLVAAEQRASRCVAVMAEGAMTTAATLLWEPVHGEPRVPLPALPELIGLLLARGFLPEVTLVERIPPTTETLDELLESTRRQLWVRPGSARDARLSGLVRQLASEREAGWSLHWRPTRIGIVSWEPGA